MAEGEGCAGAGRSSLRRGSPLGSAPAAPPLLSHQWLAGAVAPGGRRRGAVALCWLLSALQLADSSLECKTEEGVCYQGTNLPITFAGSSHQGCRELPGTSQCCELCASYWPLCLSWQFIREGNNENGYPGMSFYCCLKGSLRPSPLAASYCDSGYQNPRCTMTAPCTVEVTGTNLEATDSVMIVEGASCGDSGSVIAAWPGFQNPQVSTSLSATRSEFAMGSTTTGAVGDYALCYRKGGNSGSAADYTTTVGGFTMRGPPANQVSLVCTLGLECVVTVPGVELRNDPAGYYILMVADSGSAAPCNAGATPADFDGLSNPDNVEDDNDDNTWRMGVAKAGDTTLTYAACWAKDPASLADYTHHVGSFVMLGPVSVGHACTLGLACHVSLAGAGFTGTSALLVAVGVDPYLCLYLIESTVAQFDAQFANPQRTLGTAPYKNYSFGTPQLTASSSPGTAYRLCWSSGPALEPPAKQLSDYNIDAGLFTLHGPNEADQGCTLSLPCVLQLTGSGLELMDYGVLVVGASQPCGDASAGLANASGGNWTNPAAGGITGLVHMGISTTGLASESYSACWGARPTSLGDYPVRLGSFTMAGPFSTSGLTCTKGISCTLVLSGVGLASTNGIMLLQPLGQCGFSTNISDFSPMYNQKGPNSDGIYERYELGMGKYGMAQAGYTVCWGADPGSLTEYTVTTSDFTMVGANVRDTDCVLSAPCEIQLPGYNLTSTNRLIVVQSGQCGDAQPVLTNLVGLLNNVGVQATDPYDTYRLGTAVSGVPGVFTLCWGHAPGEGASPDLYPVPVGMLTVKGPVQEAQRCILSTRCAIQLSGTGLNTSNRVLIISSSSTCGDASPTVATFGGLMNPQGPVNASNPGLYELGTGSSAPDGVGSIYFICWGHDPASLEDYRTLLGTFTISGPIEGPLVYCTMGLPCSLTVEGHNFASTNSIMVTSILDTCGQTTLNAASFVGMANPATVEDRSPWQDYSLGTGVSGSLPGDYAVCWSHHGGGHDQFDVRIATLRMGGPTPADRQCTLSEPCRISFAGVRVAHTSKVLVVSEASTCGEASPGIADWQGFVNPAATALIRAPDNPGYNFSDGDTYSLGLPFANPPSTSYKICWAFDPTAAGGSSDYNVPLGRFTMNGPKQDVRGSCTMGQPCNLQLSGVGLAATNRLMIVAGDEACGSSDITQALLPGIENPRLVTDDLYDNSYSMGMVVVGGAYSTCRVPTPAASCIGSHYRLCWAHGIHAGVSSEHNYVVEVGSFTMSGPFVAYSIECMLGLVCAFRLYGAEFRRGNGILIIEGHGSCGTDSPPVAYFDGLSNPVPVGEVTNGVAEATFRLGRSNSGQVGTYRVCWGYNPLVMRHYNIEVGPFIFRGLSSECSVRDPFGVECQ